MDPVISKEYTDMSGGKKYHEVKSGVRESAFAGTGARGMALEYTDMCGGGGGSGGGGSGMAGEEQYAEIPASRTFVVKPVAPSTL